MKIKQVEIEKLIPYVNNSRTHDDAQVAQIAASIKEFGWTNPILTDGDNGIIAGHGRLVAARKLGMTTVPVIELEGMTDAQKKAYVIADNKLALNAGWDNELLMLELNALSGAHYDLDLTGYSDNFLDELSQGKTAELGLLPDEKLDNFLNGDTKILRLAYDEQEFATIVEALEKLQQKTGLDDFSTIIFGLVLESCEK